VSNTLSELFHNYPNPAYGPPEGATIYLWNPVTLSFDTNSTFTHGSWTFDFTLPPGVGAMLVTPEPFSNSFYGYVINSDGTLPIPDGPAISPFPPVFTGPNGLYLLADKAPQIDTGTNIFLSILGRIPFVGEQVITFSSTNTYLGNGTWDSIPTLKYGQAAFLNIMSEPSPLLSIICTNGNIIVSWPLTARDWILETNSDPLSLSWQNYLGPITNNCVTNTLSTGSLFYRLTYP
jgi:hypothetical protein